MTETILDIPTIRKALNLTQTQLAEMAGVNLSTVWRWENAGIPNRGPARAFLDRLNNEASAAHKRSVYKSAEGLVVASTSSS